MMRFEIYFSGDAAQSELSNPLPKACEPDVFSTYRRWKEKMLEQL